MVEARTKVSWGHQPTSGPGSVVPMAGQGRAVVGLRQAPYSITGARTDGPGGAEMGSCAMGGVQEVTWRLVRAIKCY